jgi:DNA-binding CsgD family transcriptional regulator
MDRPVQSELDLIGYIYDAVLEPDRWSDTIDRIRRYLGLHVAAISILHLPGGFSIQATANISPELLRIAAEEADHLPALWGGIDKFSRLPLEEPIRMAEHTSPESWAGNPYFERFGRPLGLADQLVLVLEFNPTMVATFSIGRHESMPPIDEWQIEVFRRLAPHLRRAVLISKLLESHSLVAASLESTLDTLGSAVMLVDAGRRIVHANEQAESMLREGDPIARLNGRLTIPRELVKGQFEETVAVAASGEEGLRQGAGLPVRRLDGAGMVVHVLPLGRRRFRPSAGAVAAVFVSPPSSELNLPLEAMRVLYDLRPAEVRVLELIAAGANGNGVAEALSISRNTAKTHTLRLFDKLGVHSRAELILLARKMSVGGG